MWSCCVIEQSPIFDQDLRLAQIIEDFTGQQLISELRVKTLAVTVFPGATWLDIERSDVQVFEPFAQRIGNKFRTIAPSEVLYWNRLVHLWSRLYERNRWS